jgi:8-oxo-dGTP diphosphatase
MSEQNNLPQILLVYRALIISPEAKILLVRRADNETWAPGTWEFPGGKFDNGQDIEAVIHREVMEETGLNITLNSGLAFHENITVPIGKYAGSPFVMNTLLVKKYNGDVNLSHEHSDFGWFTFDECLQKDLNRPTRSALLGLKPLL